MSYYVYSYSQERTIRDLTLEDAESIQRVKHAKNTDHFHEIHEKGIGGIRQLAPDDCWNCGRNIHKCECEGLGYVLSDCLGNCENNSLLKHQCRNTDCALNPWCSSYVPKGATEQ